FEPIGAGPVEPPIVGLFIPQQGERHACTEIPFFAVIRDPCGVAGVLVDPEATERWEACPGLRGLVFKGGFCLRCVNSGLVLSSDAERSDEAQTRINRTCRGMRITSPQIPL